MVLTYEEGTIVSDGRRLARSLTGISGIILESYSYVLFGEGVVGILLPTSKFHFTGRFEINPSTQEFALGIVFPVFSLWYEDGYLRKKISQRGFLAPLRVLGCNHDAFCMLIESEKRTQK